LVLYKLKLKSYERAAPLKDGYAKLKGLMSLDYGLWTMLARCRILRNPPYDHFGGEKMNRKNMRKNAPRTKCMYLTAKERKIVEWYESKRVEAKQRDVVINDGR
jgi:hypothetical protein